MAPPTTRRISKATPKKHKVNNPALIEDDLNPYTLDRPIRFKTDPDEEEDWFLDKLLPATQATATAFYGSTLMLYSKAYPGQIHIVTMLRATGFEKIEQGLSRIRRNFRDAYWSIIWNSPSFFRARRHYRSVRKRVQGANAILKETRKAKADGIVTKYEAAKIRNLRQAEMAAYQKELKSMRRAGASLRKVWQALDFAEMRDVVKGFLFQMMAVLATGHNENMIGKVISKWCLFINLGTFFLDINKKLRYPISKLILTRNFLTDAGITKEQSKMIERSGQALMFSSAGYLVLNKGPLAREINASGVSAAILYKGLRMFLDTFWDRSEDGVEGDSIWSTGGGMLQEYPGGLLLIAMTAVAMQCRQSNQPGGFLNHTLSITPDWLLYPLNQIEMAIDRLVLVIDKII